MDRDKADKIKIAIMANLREIEARYEVLFDIGRITYSNTEMNFKMSVVESDGSADTFLEAEFISKCGQYGLRMEDLGRLVKINGSVHEIIGLKVKNRKYPIITERQDNKKQYKLTAWQVTEAIRRIDGTR